MTEKKIVLDDAKGRLPDDADAFVDRLARVAPTILYVFDLKSMTNVWVNRSIYSSLGYTEAEIEAMGSEVIGRLMHPEDAARYADHFATLIDLGPDESARFEYRMKRKSGEWRWLVSEEVAFSRDEKGQVAQVVGSAHDITEQKEREERDANLTREVRHRVKNLFAIVPAIVNLSLRHARDMNAARQAIANRVTALSRASAMTLEVNAHDDGVALEEVIGAVLEPHGGHAEAFFVSGPPTRLNSRASNVVGLVLHELATNAIEHGALTLEGGTVRIAWVVDKAEAHESAIDGRDRMVRIQWSEQGGPTIEGPPEHTGFGLKVSQQLVRSQSGTIAWDWRGYGMSVEIEMPLYPLGREPVFPGT